MPKQLIKPDLDFVEYIVKRGGGHFLKKCFQCATCSAICMLTPDDRPFPRKEMIMAQWGLKDQLMKDPDIWLCHNCQDCSTYCPRGAKPGEVLNALRNYAIMHLVFPPFLRNIPWFTYLLPIAAMIALYILLPNPFSYALMMLFIVIGWMIAVGAFGLIRFWKNINQFKPASANPAAKRGFSVSLVSALAEVLRHIFFRQCKTNKGAFLPHLLIFYGFISLMVVDIGAQIYWLTEQGLPLPLTNPLKFIGIMGGLALFIGLVLIIYRRLFKVQEMGKATYFDWLFIVLLLIISITGLSLPLLRLARATGVWFHQIYLLHLLFTFALGIYTPFSKVMHPLYRLLAMTYAKQISRELRA